MKPNHPHVQGIDPRAFRCLFCCHVKTGTLIFGIFMTLCELVMLGLLVLAAIQPEVLVSSDAPPSDAIVVVQTDQGQVFEKYPAEVRQEKIARSNLHLMFGVSLIGLIASISLIYGVAKNRCSHILPFFCLQVFDFCLACLTVVGGFTYASDIKQWLHEQRVDTLPGMDHLMCMDSQYLTLLVALGLISFLSTKAYLIGMVWACYKYIQLYVASRSVVREFSVDPDNEDMLLPPRYEDVIKITPSHPTPPPAYVSE